MNVAGALRAGVQLNSALPLRSPLQQGSKIRPRDHLGPGASEAGNIGMAKPPNTRPARWETAANNTTRATNNVKRQQALRTLTFAPRAFP
jgi:hypothetical protein